MPTDVYECKRCGTQFATVATTRARREKEWEALDCAGAKARGLR